MSRKLLLAALLLTTGLVLADAVPEKQARGEGAEPVAGSDEMQVPGEEGSESAPATDEEQPLPEDGPKRVSGMSILGNQEAPKSLVIVPWKTSELGDAVGVSTMLDDSRQPVDKEVFLRALRYYEIRTETTP